jgi:protein-S-isoprenylcysteine O-methyltransferase Ste14
VRNLLEPKKVPWTTRSKTLFLALCLYSSLETMQLLGVAQNPKQYAPALNAPTEAVAWRAGILAVLALLVAISAAAAAWSVQTMRLDWHKAHGLVTSGLYALYGLTQVLLAWLLVPSQTRVGLVLLVVYGIFALLALNASRRAAT